MITNIEKEKDLLYDLINENNNIEIKKNFKKDIDWGEIFYEIFISTKKQIVLQVMLQHIPLESLTCLEKIKKQIMFEVINKDDIDYSEWLFSYKNFLNIFSPDEKHTLLEYSMNYRCFFISYILIENEQWSLANKKLNKDYLFENIFKYEINTMRNTNWLNNQEIQWSIKKLFPHFPEKEQKIYLLSLYIITILQYNQREKWKTLNKLNMSLDHNIIDNDYHYKIVSKEILEANQNIKYLLNWDSWPKNMKEKIIEFVNSDRNNITIEDYKLLSQIIEELSPLFNAEKLNKELSINDKNKSTIKI